VDCPIHNESMRVEYDRNAPRGEPFVTGFCLKCLRHYTQCHETRYTNHCGRVLGHDSPHRASNGEEWSCTERN
jgi:hypothetical protein